MSIMPQDPNGKTYHPSAPAETQQDDGLRCQIPDCRLTDVSSLTVTGPVRAHKINICMYHRVEHLWWVEAYGCQAGWATDFTARPPADAETLRRVWEEGYRAAQSDAASKPYADHPARVAWKPTLNPYGATLNAR